MNPIDNQDNGQNTNPKNQLTRNHLIAIGLFVVILLSAGIYANVKQSNPKPTTEYDASLSADEEQLSQSTVTLTTTGIVPATITIPIGGSVTWTNEDTKDRVISFVGHEDLDSDVLKPKASYSLTFDEPGTYNYSDAANPSFTGTVIVE